MAISSFLPLVTMTSTSTPDRMLAMNIGYVLMFIFSAWLSYYIFFTPPGKPLTVKQLKKYHNFATEFVSKFRNGYVVVLWNGSHYIVIFHDKVPPPTFCINNEGTICEVEVIRKEAPAT